MGKENTWLQNGTFYVRTNKMFRLPQSLFFPTSWLTKKMPQIWISSWPKAIFLLVYLLVWSCQQRKKSVLYTVLPTMCLRQVCDKHFACQNPLQRVCDVNLTGGAEEARSCSWSGWDLVSKSSSPTCSPETALSFPFKYKYFHSNNTSHSVGTIIIFMYQNPCSHLW